MSATPYDVRCQFRPPRTFTKKVHDHIEEIWAAELGAPDVLTRATLVDYDYLCDLLASIVPEDPHVAELERVIVNGECAAMPLDAVKDLIRGVRLVARRVLDSVPIVATWEADGPS